MKSAKSIQIFGLSFKTAPIAVREQFAKLSNSAEEQIVILKEVKKNCNLDEIALISTCNRFEIVFTGSVNKDQIIVTIKQITQTPVDNNHFYYLTGKQAYQHIFKVAASLDSQVIGESQILGQVKKSYSLAVQYGFVDKLLHGLFQYAFFTAKRVRNKTTLAEQPISISYLAIKLATQVFEDLKNCKILIIGSGEMSELSLLYLQKMNCSNIALMNRSLENIRDLASKSNYEIYSLDDWAKTFTKFDIIISAINVDQALFDLAILENRKNTSLVIDLGLPRNFKISKIENSQLYYYNLDDLILLAKENEELRQDAASQAQIIIDYAVLVFERWLTKLELEPEIISLRSQILEICSEELNKILPANKLEEISHNISQKISHYLQEELEFKSLATTNLERQIL